MLVCTGIGWFIFIPGIHWWRKFTAVIIIYDSSSKLYQCKIKICSWK